MWGQVLSDAFSSCPTADGVEERFKVGTGEGPLVWGRDPVESRKSITEKKGRVYVVLKIENEGYWILDINAKINLEIYHPSSIQSSNRFFSND